MSITLKQILTRIEELAQSHKQINHFFVGGADEFLDQEDVVYPALFCELQQDGNVSLTNRVCQYNFKFYFLDLIDVADRSLNNQWEIKSDMASVASDFMALIYDQTFTDWEINQDFAMNVVEWELQDLTAGVVVDVSIGSRFDANRCQVPSTYVFDEYADSNLTLKQTIERIQGLALSHKQINNFFIGRFDEFLDGPDVIYPSLFAELNEPGRISVTDRLIHYTFTFYFFDLLDIADRSLNNEFEVKSDMASVAFDFLSMLNYTGFQHSWEIGTEYQMSIKDYQLQDLTCGVSVRVDISTRFDANKCQVPIELGNFLLWNDTDKFLIGGSDKLVIFD